MREGVPVVPICAKRAGPSTQDCRKSRRCSSQVKCALGCTGSTYLCQEGGPEHAGLQEEKAVLLTSKMCAREYRYGTYLCLEGGPEHPGLQEEKVELLTSTMCGREYR